ncbi:MAG: GGDEF domain-containing protein [Clostridia bacterium]|nr:GGDEF domain-containing protein [Clostridia bacterium]
MNSIMNNRKYPLEERMVLFVYLTMVLSILVIVVMNIIQGIPMVNNIKWLVFIIFIMAAAYTYIKKENRRRLIRDISFILTIFVIFPMLYIFSGGLRTAAIPYMIVLLLSLIYSFSGKMRIFLLTSYILIAQALMIINLLLPGIFPYVSDEMMFLDWITNTPVILILISLLALWVSKEHHYEREKAAEFSREMEQISRSDTLTGIFNRRYLRERVDELDKSEGNVCLFIFDIDRFKNINDTLGHAEGDRILVKVAEYMMGIFGEMTSIRFGGDEFLLIGSGCPPKVMNERLKEFRKALADNLNVTISGGIVKYSGNLEEALKKADGLLYKAKEGGRNKVIAED